MLNLMMFPDLLKASKARQALLTGFAVATLACGSSDLVPGEPAPEPAAPTPQEAPPSPWGDTVDNPGRTAELPEQAGSYDYPAFRGGNRDAVLPNVTIGSDWETNPPKELWRRKIGDGRSSFAAVGDYVFTQEQRGPNEVVVCYDAATGDEIWINAVRARFTESRGDGPRATPTFHDGRLYTQGAMGALQCLDASTGEVIWARDVTEDAGSEVLQYGFSSSPLVIDNLVYAVVAGPDGKGMAAYNIVDGEPAWFSGNGVHTYASPHFATLAGRGQIILPSEIGLEAFDPATGDVLWNHLWNVRINPRCTQPVFPADNQVLIGTAGGIDTILFEVANVDGDLSAATVWASKDFQPFVNDAVLHEGHLYGFDNRTFVCMDVSTGEVKWKGRPHAGQLVMLPEMDAVLIVAEIGFVRLVRVSPEEEVELGRFHALTGTTYNYPTVANGRLFVRNALEAACYELPEV
jgi:outer membrane protein assembly factor BamB